MEKHEVIRRILLASVFGNAAICALKILGGVISRSTALLADGSDSLLNVASGAIAYKSRIEAEKPPDLEHRYGHSLLEVYGSLLILMLMVATFSFIGFLAINRLMQGVAWSIDPIGIPFAAASLVLNTIMSILLRRFGRASSVARTESRHISLDAAEGVITLTGVSLGAHISALYDIAATFILLALVSIFVAQTLRELKADLTAESPPEEVVKIIENALVSVEGVKGVHDLRIRQAGAKIFADVHLEVDKSLRVDEAHRICDEAEDLVKKKLRDVDLIIHIEPEGEE